MMRSSRQVFATSLLLVVVLPAINCAARGAPEARDFVPPSNDTVSAYGVTLDPQAEAQQTAWVLLSAVRDFLHRPRESEQQHESLKLLCQLADLGVLRSELGKLYSDPREVDQFILEIVQGWAPALNYYADGFDTDHDIAVARMTLRVLRSAADHPDKPPIVSIDYPVPARYHDDGSVARRGVTVRLQMSRNAAGYWRVWRILLRPPQDDTSAQRTADGE